MGKHEGVEVVDKAERHVRKAARSVAVEWRLDLPVGPIGRGSGTGNGNVTFSGIAPTSTIAAREAATAKAEWLDALNLQPPKPDTAA